MKNIQKATILSLILCFTSLIGFAWLYPQTIFANNNLQPVSNPITMIILMSVTIYSIVALILSIIISSQIIKVDISINKDE